MVQLYFQYLHSLLSVSGDGAAKCSYTLGGLIEVHNVYMRAKCQNSCHVPSCCHML